MTWRLLEADEGTWGKQCCVPALLSRQMCVHLLKALEGSSSQGTHPLSKYGCSCELLLAKGETCKESPQKCELSYKNTAVTQQHSFCLAEVVEDSLYSCQGPEGTLCPSWGFDTASAL